MILMMLKVTGKKKSHLERIMMVTQISLQSGKRRRLLIPSNHFTQQFPYRIGYCTNEQIIPFAPQSTHLKSHKEKTLRTVLWIRCGIVHTERHDDNGII